MRKLFIVSLLLFGLYELTTTWLVMPLPGSQGLDSVETAWFLYHYRWFIRGAFVILLAISVRGAFAGGRKWQPVLMLVIAGLVIYASNFILSAEALFQPPSTVRHSALDDATLPDDAIVIAVQSGDEVKAYPVRYIAYHHQVADHIGGKSVLVTYCSVCRSGRVYDAVAADIPAQHLRLVGMTHFNAMFEDPGGSWWMQATGEAVAGPRKGDRLPEIPSFQTSLGALKKLYPQALLMNPDQASADHYDNDGRFEKGQSKGDLTRADSASWNNKSWIVGIIVNGQAKAYDWKKLIHEKVINDTLAGIPVSVAITADHSTFAAFRRADQSPMEIRNDTLIYNGSLYLFSGSSVNVNVSPLEKVPSYQEHWHSWKKFHGENRYFP